MSKQVFQTDSRQRWSYFKWTLRVILTILSLLESFSWQCLPWKEVLRCLSVTTIGMQ